MNINIESVPDFISCIFDYITEYFAIEPRDSELQLLQLNIGHESLLWDDGMISTFSCPLFNKKLHVHPEYGASNVVCCSGVDVMALKYIESCIFSPEKYKIIATMHHWLPAATANYVGVRYNLTFDETIRSYFEPSYCSKFAGKMLVYYYYFDSNIVDYSDYAITDPHRTIMVRRRSRSRSSSPSSSSATSRRGRRGSPRRRRRSRSRSRSRSQSPSSAAYRSRANSTGRRRRRTSRST